MGRLLSLLCIMTLSLLLMSSVAMAEEPVNLIPNHDFSEGLDANGVPKQWTLFSRTATTGFYLSDERASVGSHSLYMFDESTQASGGIRSARVPVTPGNWYLAEVDVWVERGSLAIYVDFLDKDGKRVQARTASISQTSGWHTELVNAQAPEGAAYVTLILYSFGNTTGAGYFDNVRLYDVSDVMVDGPTLTARSPVPGSAIGFRPFDGSQVLVNPPPLIWLPVSGATSYTVELSRDPEFPTNDTERITGIELPLYTHLRALESGLWYWRYQGVGANGAVLQTGDVRSFYVPEGVPELPLPPREEWMARIPKEHPRLFVRPDTIDEIRSRLHTAFVESVLQQGRAAARVGAVYPDEPPAPREDGVFSIERWRNAGNQMIPPLETLHEIAALYLITQKEVYAEEGKKLLLHFARMDPAGLTSYRNGAPEVAMRMLYFLPRAYTWLYDVLTEEERDIVRHSARVRGQEAYSMIKGRPFETNPYGSHQGRMLGFLGQLSIAFLGEIPEAEDWLEYVVQMMFAVYPAWGGDDGGYSEGLSYWSSYMNWVFDFFDAFEVATGINLYNKPFFRNTGYFAIYAGSPGMRSPFSDGPNAAIGAGHRRVVTQLARMHQNGHYAWYVDQLGGPLERSGVHRFLLDRPGMPPIQVPDDLPDARWFQDVGWVTLHRDLANPKENVQFTFKSSPYGSASHAHSDQNAFVLYAYGDGLAISSGYYPWSGSPHHSGWTNQTVSKNSLLFDGRGQPTWNIEAKGHILGLFHSDRYDYTAGEAATAYHHLFLRRFSRHVIYLRPDVFVLVDDVRASRPLTVDWLYHSAFEIKWDPAGQVARVEGSAAEMELHILTPHNLEVSISNEFVPPPELDSCENAWHMTARLPEKVDEAVIVSVMTPRKRGAAGPVLVDGAVTQEGDWLLIELTIDEGGALRHESIYMRFPAANELPDLAELRIVTRSASGELVSALAVGDQAPSSASVAILTVPDADTAVAATWDRVAGTVSVTTGVPRLGQFGTDDLQGIIVLASSFAPTEVWLDGELLPNTAWSYDGVRGELQIGR